MADKDPLGMEFMRWQNVPSLTGGQVGGKGVIGGMLGMALNALTGGGSSPVGAAVGSAADALGQGVAPPMPGSPPGGVGLAPPSPLPSPTMGAPGLQPPANPFPTSFNLNAPAGAVPPMQATTQPMSAPPLGTDLNNDGVIDDFWGIKKGP